MDDFEGLFEKRLQGDVLNLAGCHIGEAGARALAESPHLAGVTTLNLDGNDFGDAGARALAESPHLAGVTSLNLRSNGIGEAGARALAGCSHLESLTSLSLVRNRILEAGVRHLANSLHLRNLIRFDLGESGIMEDGALAIAQSKYLTNLIELSLRDCRIGDEGAIALAKSKNFKNLEWLSLWRSDIGAVGAIALAESVHLANLTSLDLNFTYVGEQGARALAFSERLGKLQRLRLMVVDGLELPEGVDKDRDSLCRHFQLRDALEQVPGSTVRCMLIGAPHGGKTTWARLLAGLDPDWSGLARTLGVEPHSARFAGVRREEEGAGGSPDIVMQLWDCGGQSLQGMIHGLFVRNCPLFILVLRSADCLDQAPAWLDMIISQHAGKERPLVLPLINAKGAAVREIAEKLIELQSRYQSRIAFAERIALDVGPEADNARAVARLMERLRELLEDLPIPPVMRPLTGLAQLLEQEFPEPQYALNDFTRQLMAHPAFTETVDIINEALATNGDGKPMDGSTVIRDLMFYLEQEGRLVTFLFDENLEHFPFTERPGCVVKDPAWLHQGLYTLLPPEEDHPEHMDSASAVLARQMREPRDGGPPGRFDFADLRPVWRAQGIPDNHHAQILQILCKPEVGLIIDGRRRSPRYFVPAYLGEEAGPEATTSAALRLSLGHAVHAEMLDIDLWLPNGHRIWPHHFFFRAMVWLSSSPVRLSGETDLAEAFALTDLGRDCMTLSHPRRPGVAVQLIQHGARIWCILEDRRDDAGASVGQECSDLLEDIVETIRDALRAFGGKSNVVRKTPCPECIRQLDAELPKDAQALFASGLLKLHMWFYSEVVTMPRDSVVLCGKGHEARFSLLRVALPSRTRDANADDGVVPTHAEAKKAAVALGHFLLELKLAKMSGSPILGARPLSDDGHGGWKESSVHTISKNTWVGWANGRGGEFKVLKFCKYLLAVFEPVRVLANASSTRNLDDEQAKVYICAAHRALIKDREGAVARFAPK